MKKYDLIIIGSGSGLNIASKAIQQNKKIKIAIIEKSKMGGTCLNHGCIPSKMLLHYKDVIESIKSSKDFFIKSKIEKIDYEKIISSTDYQLNKLSREIYSFYKKSRQIDLYKGNAKFIDNHTLKVSKDLIYGKKIVLAIGARASIPNIQGLENIDYLTYIEALKLKTLPKTMTIIGGGYIGIELSNFFQSMGCKVTILEAKKILSNVDDEIASEFKKKFLKNIKVIENVNIKKIESKNKKITVFFNNKKITSEKLLISTGIKPNTDLIDIQNTNIKLDEKGFIKVNKYLQTSIKHIYALGDCINSYFFKHSANFESLYVFEKIFKKHTPKINYPPIGYCVFSTPEIAGVGITLKQAKSSKYYIKKANFKDIASSMIVKDNTGVLYLIFEKKTNRLKGSHVVSKNASILIHILIAFMQKKAKEEDLKEMIYIHPSFGEFIKKAL
ncbi:MAG: Dihydrolipoyl dehydrogenase [Candidatus Anoxychlamydiales bacterium]|nr:Dihydrolipoyl dehydrogenase [Candidatus Anoxychlamydiales bacterium]